MDNNSIKSYHEVHRNLLCSMFEWKNLPDSAAERFPELAAFPELYAKSRVKEG